MCGVIVYCLCFNIFISINLLIINIYNCLYCHLILGDFGNVSNVFNPTSSGGAATATSLEGESPSDVGENLSTTQDELQSHYFGNGAPDLSTCVKEGKAAAAAAASYFQSDKGVGK